MTQAWLRRNRGRFLILAAVLAPLVIGANLAAARWSSLRWSAGLVTGMVVAMFVIARMSPPPWIENWQDGAIGEQWTGRALRELESQGWRIFHDLTASHGNMDHVVPVEYSCWTPSGGEAQSLSRETHLWDVELRAPTCTGSSPVPPMSKAWPLR